MDKKDMRSKRASIRKEIKERMQAELDKSKKEIKRRLKRENISVEEKRERYRQEAHREKLRLMDLAKQEFRARKRMMGDITEQGGLAEDDEEFKEGFVEAPSSADDDSMLLAADEEYEEKPDDGVDPKEAFILEDTTEEREALRKFEAPIEESDVIPGGRDEFEDKVGVGPAFEEEEGFEVNSLFYYAFNIILHPIRTLDEFDDYLITPPGMRNLVIFYLVSLLPIVVFILLSSSVESFMPGGLLGTVIGSSLQAQVGIPILVGRTILDLVLYSLSIAVVNYLFTNEFNFITLTSYFAFVEAVTRVVVYTLIILAILGALIAPPILIIIALLFLAFLIWSIALNIIVLMNTYGYGVFSAFLLAVGAYVARRLIYLFVSGLFGVPLEDAL